MSQAWTVPLLAVSYLLILFAVASYGDRLGRRQTIVSRPNIYAFSLAIYCTTWTFFGSVGLAASSGINFLAIYLGPVIFVTLGFPLLKRIVHLSKEQRITSVADFIGARYGKNMKVAAVAAVIAVFGTIPYIALQLKAISDSVTTLITFRANTEAHADIFSTDITFLITATLAVFTILFGTRHADATEHQDGLMLAVATESVIKLLTFLCVGIFAVYFLFDGFSDLFKQASELEQVQTVIARGFDVRYFSVLTLLSLMAFALLPRQFHVAVVENRSPQELQRARWLFPLYLVGINIFVVPIALAGMINLGSGANADAFVLLLPLSEGSSVVSLMAFIGGLSAGTAMVIVASVALAIMVSNDLILPFYLQRQGRGGPADTGSMQGLILNIRRTAIIITLGLAYIYYSISDSSAALASIGLISFVAISQLAPAFFGGMAWKRATAFGATLGMTLGFVFWGYTLLLPTILPTDHSVVTNGLLGMEFLRPHSLLYFDSDPISHGMFWSLGANIVGYVVGSLLREQEPFERMQASNFVTYNIQTTRTGRGNLANVSVRELKTAVSRYLGQERTDRAFAAYWEKDSSTENPDSRIDHELLGFSEQLLASAIGASSSRLVHSLLLKRLDSTSNTDIKLLNEASEAVRHNQGVLQSAFNQIDQGIGVFDEDLRLTTWNRKFRSLLTLPSSLGRAGISLAEIAKEIVVQNGMEEFDPEGDQLAHRLIHNKGTWNIELPQSGKTLEINCNPMPDGGLVMTWNDITEKVLNQLALEDANETLERRVEERTSDLVHLNEKLKLATNEADDANRSKTRFLAAAGHDILQPLNAARLYSATLHEKLSKKNETELVEKVGKSLASVEDILGAVLAISRLDSAKLETHPRIFPISDTLEQLDLEFQPIAQEKGLPLKIESKPIFVETDPALLRRMLQNLISNGIKYTKQGSVEVTVEEINGQVIVKVLDTGIGISNEDSETVFAEFRRLEDGARAAPGLGLGLSIVRRIAKLLKLDVTMKPRKNGGTEFIVNLPQAIPLEASNDNQLGDKKRVAANPASLTGIRILCIDNDPAILDGMASLLGEWQCDVLIAGDLAMAVALCTADRKPEIILADYHLDAGKNGIDAIVELRTHLQMHTPAILVTADRSAELKNEALENDLLVLNKPVKAAALRAMINQQLSSRVAAE